MNFLDVILLAILLFFTVRGLLRGLIKEVLTLLSFVAAMVLARYLYPVVAPHLAVYITNEAAVAAASYLLVFVAVVLGASLLISLLRSKVEMPVLSTVDRVAGMAFGFVEGGILCLVVILLLQTFLGRADFIQESKVSKAATPYMGLLADLTPEAVRESLAEAGVELPESSEASLTDIISESFQGGGEEAPAQTDQNNSN